MKHWWSLIFLGFLTPGILFLYQQSSPSTPQFVHIGKPFDKAFYDRSYSLGKKYLKEPQDKIFGGIIPHHLLVAPLIAAFFEGLSKQDIKTVILIGPNHYNLDDGDIITANGIWKTIYGDLEVDTKKLDQMLLTKVLVTNNKTFSTEHSIYGIITFIKISLPQAKVIPVIFKSYTSQKDADELVRVLDQIVDDKTLVVASVDFSHYRSLIEAEKYDQQSLEAIKNFDLDQIIKLDSTKNFDSPAAIYTLLKLLKSKSKTNLEVLHHENSASYTNEPDLKETTSYFTIYFN